MYNITEEQRHRYNENRRLKLASQTPEEREARLRARRAYEKEKRRIGGEERRLHDREIQIAYVNRKRMENPNWEADRYAKSKSVKAQRASRLAATLSPGEKICSRCKFVRNEDDFPYTRQGDRSTMCRKCFDLVTKRFDTADISYWKVQASSINSKARRRLKLLGRYEEPGAFTCITGDELMAKWDQQQHRCAYCGIQLTPLITAYDHKVPISKGGTHCADNIQLLCHNCNVSKFTMTDERYRSLIQ